MKSATRSNPCFQFSALVLVCALALGAAPLMASDPIVIAHRGASGYLPEHTLAAKVLAHAQGADYIEQDVVMTRDDQLVVLHDLKLDRVTDVARVFQDRHRADGRYYVVDFTLAELRTLRVTSGFRPTGPAEPAEESREDVLAEVAEEVVEEYPGRFPLWQSRFGIHTLAEEIELIQGLNLTTGRKAGIYPEIKSPGFHRREGKDLSAAILQVLKDYGYDSRDAKVYLQTFDFNELVRVRQELLPQLDMDLKLVQLIADNSWQETLVQDDSGRWIPYDYNWMHSAEGMAELARYAQGVGPHLYMIAAPGADGGHTATELVHQAHQAGLKVHPYTFRAEPNRLPPYAGDFEQLLEIFIDRMGVDGLFTDFPDRALRFIHQRRSVATASTDFINH